ncbi:MAG TPA: hypothetical protein VEJ86_02605, partial [Candidatus Binataceae bacterium]|nr:hypothetical protein [Candidatus Binataceae bacterium]
MNATLEAVRTAAAPFGLNLVAAIGVERYDAAALPAYRAQAIASGARSIIVIGNGGRALWDALKRYAHEHPGWMSREHPLDDFTRDVIEREVAPAARHNGSCTVVYPFVSVTGPTLSFMQLGRLAGLAGPSILGVSVHPRFGPWLAFRAALLVEEIIDQPAEALGYDPCPSCTARSCIAACPVGAVSLEHGWDIPKCLTHRVEVEP